jgi:hypothetical protein
MVAEGSWRCASRALDESVFERQYPPILGRLREFCQRPFRTAGKFTAAHWEYAVSARGVSHNAVAFSQKTAFCYLEADTVYSAY